MNNGRALPKYIPLILVMIVVPLIGLAVGAWAHWYYNYETHQAFIARGFTVAQADSITFSQVCMRPDIFPDFSSFCLQYTEFNYLILGSLAALLLGLMLITFIKLAGIATRKNRNLLVSFFAPGFKFVLIALAIIMLAHGAIAAYSIYLLETILMDRWQPILIGFILFGAVAYSFWMVESGFSLAKIFESRVIGKILDIDNNNDLFEFINKIAASIGASAPKNVIVGLEPTFYVTAANIVTLGDGKVCRDETMYLSLPLMRLLSKEELAAIIGHELAHFKGEDTKYSLRFAPIYSGIIGAINSLVEQSNGSSDGASKIALIPAFFLLGFFMEEFSKSERSVGRLRELQADREGAKITSKDIFCSSLLKAAAFGPVWQTITNANIENLNKGMAYQNLSLFYQEYCRSINIPAFTNDVISSFSEATMIHPTDTHPPLFVRLQNLDINASELKSDILQLSADPAITLLPNAMELEEALTQNTHQLMLHYGWAKLPEQAA
jgi:Zn-dependent protease with chaperone function